MQRVMPETAAPRIATREDAVSAAELLDRFNREFDAPTPGRVVLADRLRRLIPGGDVVVVLAGAPAVAVALLTLRPNVWHDGPVGLLDELYVLPSQRGRGIGAAVLHAVEDVCRRRGSALLEIAVDGQDADARRFYERHGYADRAPGQVQPQLYYSRELTAPGPPTGGRQPRRGRRSAG